MIQRDTFASCPTCQRGLDPTPDGRRLSCAECRGVMVEETALLEAISAVIPAGLPRPEALPLEAPSKDEPFVVCPRCTARMVKHSLYDIQVDRCEPHGLWFDGGELQDVLTKVQKHELTTEEKIQMGIGGLGVTALIALQIVRFVWG